MATAAPPEGSFRSDILHRAPDGGWLEAVAWRKAGRTDWKFGYNEVVPVEGIAGRATTIWESGDLVVQTGEDAICAARNAANRILNGRLKRKVPSLAHVELVERVLRGVRLLDALFGPTWIDSIVLTRMDMLTSDRCPLAQLADRLDVGDLGVDTFQRCAEEVEDLLFVGSDDRYRSWYDDEAALDLERHSGEVASYLAVDDRAFWHGWFGFSMMGLEPQHGLELYGAGTACWHRVVAARRLRGEVGIDQLRREMRGLLADRSKLRGAA